MGVRGKSGSASAPPPQAPPSPSTAAPPSATPEPTQETPHDPKDEGTPKAGHNSKQSLMLVGDGERASYYALVTRMAMRLDGKVKDLTEQIKAFRDEKSQLFKEGKARLGFNRADFEFGIQLKRSKEAEDGGSAALETHRRHIQIAIWENHPIATQPELPLEGGSAPDRTPSVDRAFLEGLTAGREPDEDNRGCSPPSSWGPAQAQAWMKGWHQGDGERKTLKNLLRPLQEGGLWPDDPKPEEPLGTIYDPENDPDPDASNIVPIGTAASTAEAL